MMDAAPSQQIRLLFCQRYNCPAPKFEARALRKCLYWHARWLAPVVRLVKPRFFAEDLAFIHHLGEASSMEEIESALLHFRAVSLDHKSYLRIALKIRVSSRKAFQLVQELLAEEGEPGFATR
jgi:hypothetical protein